MNPRKCAELSKLSLPLFLASRNRLEAVDVKNYILKNVKTYLRPTETENSDSNDEVEDYRQANACKNNVDVNLPTSKTEKSKKGNLGKVFNLAPNRYNIPSQIGKNVKSVAWRDLKRTLSHDKEDSLRNTGAFYEVSINLYEKLQHQCHRHKGKLSSDSRNRKPTSRIMVSNPVLCWRDEKEPGPASYSIGVLRTKMFPKKSKNRLTSYKFPRYSCVPESVRFNILKSSSFAPGPGRYELLDDEDSLQIQFKLENQKRYRFRRLDFKRIRVQKPNLYRVKRHIFGYGFTRLFRGVCLSPGKATSKKYSKANLEVKLFPSSDYIRMITNPERNKLSVRSEHLPKESHPLRFNCLVNFKIRGQLRDNKKVVFGSGVPRFKSLDAPHPKKIQTPPPFVNYPVMKVNTKDIRSKLHTLPGRLCGTYKTHRMQPFKFQPIPNGKLLLDEKEVHPENEETLEKYPKNLSPSLFLKEFYKTI